MTLPGADAMTRGRVAKLAVNSELASLADDIRLAVDDFSREGLWGIARGGWG
ncbi:MAG: hypothetical protein ACREMX_07290 [Gemmatimonadales bacterium]